MIGIRYLGHSCFLLESGDAKILFDPFITPNELAKHIDADTIDCNFICVSHGHGDHVADLVPVAKRTGAIVAASFEITEWLKKQGVSRVHPMNNGGSWNFGPFIAKMTNAAHSNSLPDGTYGGHAAGFLIRIAGRTIYYAGDTALNYDMKLLGEYEKIDLAFLPVGDNFTMGPDDALKAAGFINCRQIIGMHFDTFGYIVIDKEEAVKKFAAAGYELTLMKVGEQRNFLITQQQ